MPNLRDTIIFIVASRPGISDHELYEAIYGNSGPRINLVAQPCRDLEIAGIFKRKSGFFKMRNFVEPSLKVKRDEFQRVINVDADV